MQDGGTTASRHALSDAANEKRRAEAYSFRRRVGVLLRTKSTAAGFIVVFGLLLVVLIGPYLPSHNPTTIDGTQRLQGPSAQHWFGTDSFGRDVLSRMIAGARVSLAVSVAVVVTTGTLGSVLGLLSGYFRRIDNVIMRITDGLMAFPSIFLALGLVAALGARPVNIVIALTFVYVANVSRLVRSVTLRLRREEFVEAAAVVGAGKVRILGRHIFPNTLGPLVVQLTFVAAYAILTEASLSFLGAGISPTVPTWGNILQEGRRFLHEAPWLTFIPGLAIMITVLGLNLVGDGIRDYVDPRSRSIS